MVVVALLCFFFFYFVLSYWMKNKKSKPVTDWPIVGMLPGFLLDAVRRPHDSSTSTLRHFRGTVEFTNSWILNVGCVLTSDPMNINHILSKNFANYPKGSHFREVVDPLGEGIIRSDSDVWKAQRKSVLNAMHDKRFEIFSEKRTWQKVEKGLIPVLEHVYKLGMEVDLQELFRRFTFDVISSLVFGFDSNSLSVELPEIPHEKAFDDIEKAIFTRGITPKAYWKLLKWLNVGQEKKLKEGWEIFDRFLYDSISASREKLSRSKSSMENDEEFNLITAFLVEEGGGQTDYTCENSNKILRDHACNLMAAGRDTVSSCLTWFVWLVATNPSIETKILEEIKEKLLINGELRFSGKKELNALVYLQAVFCETLRLYPSVPFTSRSVVQSDVLPSGHRVDQKTKVLISFYAMGRMKQIWGEDCLDFKPERWITERGGIMHVPSYKFTAFNAGPRSCIGKDMSFIQMKIIAVALLWNYHIQPEEGHPILPKRSVTLLMKYGLKVRVTKRSG